jgi:hypothetical protein
MDRVAQAGLDDGPALGLEPLEPFRDGRVNVLRINLLDFFLVAVEGN